MRKPKDYERIVLDHVELGQDGQRGESYLIGAEDDRETQAFDQGEDDDKGPA